MYLENYKTLMKRETEDDTNIWEDISCSWIGRINIVKVTILLKTNLQIQSNPYQNINGLSHRARIVKKFE